jgi:hypothetical protein
MVLRALGTCWRAANSAWLISHLFGERQQPDLLTVATLADGLELAELRVGPPPLMQQGADLFVVVVDAGAERHLGAKQKQGGHCYRTHNTPPYVPYSPSYSPYFRTYYNSRTAPLYEEIN